MPNQESSELTEPCIGPLDDPAALVAAQFPSILVTPLFVVLSIGCDQLDASLLQSLAQWVRVVGTVGNHPFRLLPRAAFGPGKRTSLSVASASVASPGEALSSRTPNGRP